MSENIDNIDNNGSNNNNNNNISTINSTTIITSFDQNDDNINNSNNNNNNSNNINNNNVVDILPNIGSITPQFLEQQSNQEFFNSSNNNNNSNNTFSNNSNNSNNINLNNNELTNISLNSPIKSSFGVIPPPPSPIRNSIGQIPPPNNSGSTLLSSSSTSSSQSPVNSSINLNKSNSGVNTTTATKLKNNITPSTPLSPSSTTTTTTTTTTSSQLAPILHEIIRENELADGEEFSQQIGSAILTSSTSNFKDIEINEKKQSKDTKSLLKKSTNIISPQISSSSNHGHTTSNPINISSTSIGRNHLKQSSNNLPFSLLKQSTTSAISRSNASDYLRISSVASYFVNPLKYSVCSEGHMILNASQEVYPIGKDEELGYGTRTIHKNVGGGDEENEIAMEDFGNNGRDEQEADTGDFSNNLDGADYLESVKLEDEIKVMADNRLKSRVKAGVLNNRGLILLVISSFLFSIMAYLVKFVSSTLSSFEIAFLRSFYGLVGCVIILFSMRENPLGPKKFRLFLLARGLSGTISLCAYFYTITVLPLAEAVIISFTSPVITAALAAVILKEKWGAIEALCAFLSLCGVTIISKPSFLFHHSSASSGEASASTTEDGDGGNKLFYILIGIGGAFFTALSYIAVRKVGPTVNPFILVFYFSIVASVVTLPSSFIFFEFVWPSFHFWLYMTLLGVIATGAQASVNAGIQLSKKTSTAASMNYLQIIFTFIWQVTLMHESIDYITLLGALLILACAGVTAFKK